MDYQQRYKKIRLLVSRINKGRKKQAEKTDILCNDLIAAQREFIKRLNTISFAANFYKSIIGLANMGCLLSVAGKLIKNEIANSNIVFFLRQQDTFEMYPASSDSPNPVEGFFTAEVVEDICRANKICHMDDIFAMGLQGNLTILNKVSAATIPLGQFGRCIGFILIYRPCQTALADEELNRIYAVSPGLFCAIRACLVHSHT